MSEKDSILDNIAEYSSHQLLNHILEGVITVPEIIRGNPYDFDYKRRDELEELLWKESEEKADIKTVNLYLENYPEGPHKGDAETMLSRLQEGKEVLPPPQPDTIDIYNDDSRFEDEEIETAPADPWEIVDKEDIEALTRFIEENPSHPKEREARKLITSLQRKISTPQGPDWLKQQLAVSTKNPITIARIIIDAYEHGNITTRELLELLGQDHNFLPLESVKKLVEEGIFTTIDLAKAGIAQKFLDVVNGNTTQMINTRVDTDFMRNPERINQVCQEIYFWGMPSSGKTCALGAILSSSSTGKVAKTIEKNPDCNGYDYMRQLSEVFETGKVSMLPSGTSASFVSDMSFRLLDKDDKLHYITMIDLAGEMLHAMYMVDQNRQDELTPDQQTGYECMKRLLVDNTSTNSKIHFFVVEYGGHDRREKGIRQVDMLDGALAHIKKLGILKNTDAVFVLMTKADKAFNEPGDVNKVLEDYVKTHYHAFYNSLKLNTKRINGGKVEMIPFSIGEVCFQNLCSFDDETSNEMVKLLLERTVGEKTGKAGEFTKTMRK